MTRLGIAENVMESAQAALRVHAARPFFRVPPRRAETILGVSAQATTREIRRAYLAKAQLLHPDHGGSHEEMTALNRAYQEAMKRRSARG